MAAGLSSTQTHVPCADGWPKAGVQHASAQTEPAPDASPPEKTADPWEKDMVSALGLEASSG